MEDAVKERTDHGMGQGSSVRDFHSELMILRRRWRLKRTGTSIMGDLTYRSGKMMQIIFRNGMIYRYSLSRREVFTYNILDICFSENRHFDGGLESAGL